MKSLWSREGRFSPRVLQAYRQARLPAAFGLAAAAEGVAELLLYDEIGGWGVTAKDFVLALQMVGPGPLTLRINSPGGDGFEGLAMYNALRARGGVTVQVDSLAASAASIVAMGGERLVMPEQASLMIHNCWGLCIGNRQAMLAMAAVQQKLDGQMAEIYAGKSGLTAEMMTAAMDAESWYTSTEAKASGFCDEILSAAPAAAVLASSSFRPVGRLRAAASGMTLPDYDPDGDGDNDAEEALGHLYQAMGALTGLGADDDDAEDNNEYAHVRRSPSAAASDWAVGGSEDLPVDDKTSWDGPGASERMLDAAGFNGDNPDADKAKRGFLVWDKANSKLKGGYKLPFADQVGGELKAIEGGIRAAASRLPQTDIPDDVRTRARALLDAYEKKMGDQKAASRLRLRLRLAAA